MIPMRNGLNRQEAFDHTESSDEEFWKTKDKMTVGDLFYLSIFTLVYFSLTIQ